MCPWPYYTLQLRAMQYSNCSCYPTSHNVIRDSPNLVSSGIYRIFTMLSRFSGLWALCMRYTKMLTKRFISFKEILNDEIIDGQSKLGECKKENVSWAPSAEKITFYKDLHKQCNLPSPARFFHQFLDCICKPVTYENTGIWSVAD